MTRRAGAYLSDCVRLSDGLAIAVALALGAGAAAIAGMELQDHPKMDVRVIGFGSPACLSEELAADADFITVRSFANIK